jgi:hypothetical protein
VALGTGVGAAVGVAAGDVSLWLPVGATLGFLGGVVAGGRAGPGFR